MDIQNFFKKSFLALNLNITLGGFSHLNIEYPPDWYWIFKISFKKISFGFEFECHSGRFSLLNIEYPPD